MPDSISLLLACLAPPLPVFLKIGLHRDFWLNIILTILGYVPGVVHAAYIIGRESRVR